MVVAVAWGQSGMLTNEFRGALRVRVRVGLGSGLGLGLGLGLGS